MALHKNKFMEFIEGRLLLLIGISTTMIGLFSPWVRIEWKHSRGILDSTGMIIFCILIYLTMIKRIAGYRIIASSIAIAILMAVQFMNFPRIMNITWERSFGFSMTYVQTGFFITLFGVLLMMLAGFIKQRQGIR